MSELTKPNELPEFTQDDTKKDAEFPTLRTDVAMRFCVTDVVTEVNQNTGSYGFRLEAKPINAQNKPVYPSAYLRLQAPWKNPKAVGKKYETVAPNTMGQWHSFLHAIEPQAFPRFPKRQGQVWLTDDGAELTTKEQYMQERQRICARIRERVQTYWKTPDQLKQETYICQPQAEKSQDGQQTYVNLNAFGCYPINDPPTDVPVVTEGFTE